MIVKINAQDLRRLGPRRLGHIALGIDLDHLETR